MARVYVQQESYVGDAEPVPAAPFKRAGVKITCHHEHPNLFATAGQARHTPQAAVLVVQGAAGVQVRHSSYGPFDTPQELVYLVLLAWIS